MTDVYAQIAVRIIASQEAIIGPLAIEQAKQVDNLEVVNWDNQEVAISGDAPKIIDELVERYRDLFGQMSVEVSKEAAASLLRRLPAGKELPAALQ